MIDDWSEILESVRRKVPSHAFESYLKRLVPEEPDNTGKLVLKAPDRFTAARVERSFVQLLKHEIETKLGRQLSIEVHADASIKKRQEIEDETAGADSTNSSASNPPASVRLAGVNPAYTFDSFVVGPCNQVAASAAMAIAEGRDDFLNPLFLYGSTGLGKSHLACAIAHHVRRNRHDATVLYLSAEKFVNEMVSSLKASRIHEFKDRFRKDCDILILDDVQFLTGKTMTQEELFHTLDELQSARKQIVLVSDTPPREIPKLDEGLRSRFGSGLVVDLKPPGMETRKAILMHKVDSDGLDVPEEVVDYIAANVRSNVRDLEGALVRVVSFASFAGKSLNLELAREVLQDITCNMGPVSMSTVIALVSRYLMVSPKIITGKTRKRNAVLARQVAMLLTRRFCNVSLTEIGQAFNRDHSTVLHSIKAVEKKMARDPSLSRQVEFLASKIE